MKTYAVVLFAALLATAAPALAHGGEGGSPVTAPVGRPVMSSPIAFPVQGGFPAPSGVPTFSRPDPGRTIEPDRRHRERPLRLPGNTYADLCEGSIYVPALYPQYRGKSGPACPVQTQNGLLPPAFLW